MKTIIAMSLTLLALNTYAQPNCSSVAATLAADEYANSNFGGNSGTTVKTVTAKDGSIYYKVQATGEYGTTTYTVIFDDPSSCSTDTARVFEQKR